LPERVDDSSADFYENVRTPSKDLINLFKEVVSIEFERFSH
jgi:hypothetical protein